MRWASLCPGEGSQGWEGILDGVPEADPGGRRVLGWPLKAASHVQGLTSHSHPAAEVVGAACVPHVLGGRCVVRTGWG
jgi:hypothetical protein